MSKLASYSTASAIDETAITNYLLANPYDPADALEMINTQYWIASFLNTPEAFANFRRSGYPDLAPTRLQVRIYPAALSVVCNTTSRYR